MVCRDHDPVEREVSLEPELMFMDLLYLRPTSRFTLAKALE